MSEPLTVAPEGVVDESPQPAAEPSSPPAFLAGLSAYPGMSCGTVLLFSSADLEVPQFFIDKTAVRGECQRLRMAISAVDKQLTALADRLEDEEMPAEASTFVDVHRMILKDPTLLNDTLEIIRSKLVNAEWALSLRLEQTRREFDQIDDAYLRERVKDIAHVVQRVQRLLAGRRSDASLEDVETVADKVILVVDQLDPTDMLQLRERDDLDIVGIVLEEGSITSHAAILAHSFEIPTLVGVTGAREELHNGQRVLVNADENRLELAPTAEQAKAARLRMRELKRQKRNLVKLKSVSAATKDGTGVTLLANIALPDDLPDAHKAGAEGIGLFRTEFLFLNRSDLPSEDEQHEAYLRVIRSMKGKPVTIRTADLGADKALSPEAMALLGDADREEFNPSLGLRGLRFTFAYPQLLRTQLRAILRASSAGPVRILLPMVTSPTDVKRARDLIDEAKRELDEAGERYGTGIEVGGMVEVPAAVAMIRDLIPVLDFFSVGTNDLVQYTLATDRANAAVSEYYDECHPAVLRFIAEAVRRVCGAGKEISVCGEMAGRPDLTEFFLGLGCRTLSMDASSIPAVKARILRIDIEDAETFAGRLLRRRTSESVRKAVEDHQAQYLSAQNQETAQ